MNEESYFNYSIILIDSWYAAAGWPHTQNLPS